ncbi:MAG: universal stress protein [Alphaproteobacteria bacterium]
MTIRKIIVASHGTPGARAAEAAALELTKQVGGSFHHLLVIPNFWKGMMGDDWLNNAVTQIRFGNYLENQLAKETAVEIERLSDAAQAMDIEYTNEIVQGSPTNVMIQYCADGDYDLAVIGSIRPKGAEGYRSRMKLDPMSRDLKTPLMIVPHPDR